jgi:N-acetylmuramoyl-L-alanine amidase
LSWINRFGGRIFRSAAFAALCLFAAAFGALRARADAPLLATYQRQTIRFTHLQARTGSLAIGVQDSGLQALLRDVGAVLTWKPGQRYVLVTTSVPVVVSFSVGDRRYDVGPISLQASFAPYLVGNEVYLPFDETLAALGLGLHQEGSVAVLQPQLSSLDVRESDGRVTLVARAGAALIPQIVHRTAREVTYEFDGVGTSLSGSRTVGTGGVQSVRISQTGSVHDPKTDVTVRLAPGATVQPPSTNGQGEVELSFAGNGPALPTAPPQQVSTTEQAPAAMPSSDVVPAASPSAGPAIVSGLNVQPADQGVTVTIPISGNASFVWHRLRQPDNRFWVDIAGAQWQGPPVDETNEPAPLAAVRVRQIDATTVRVAISLAGPKSLSVSPSANGLTIDVGTQDVADAPRAGTGSVGNVVSSGEQTALVTPAPLDGADGTTADADVSNWKFGPRSTYVPTNPRLIVIDPGHGGSDDGAIRNGVMEKTLTLDMANKLRDILVARGWQVQMTRDTDVDVYAPNDSAKQELQARVDVANNNGARLFISIHVNAFVNSVPYGTTCYISKPGDWALARDLERQLSADGTKDDGIVKSHLYVTLHTKMPAVLVETAFLSNPSDFSLLTNPAWRQKVAQEMADGIQEYTQQYPIAGSTDPQ